MSTNKQHVSANSSLPPVKAPAQDGGKKKQDDLRQNLVDRLGDCTRLMGEYKRELAEISSKNEQALQGLASAVADSNTKSSKELAQFGKRLDHIQNELNNALDEQTQAIKDSQAKFTNTSLVKVNNYFWNVLLGLSISTAIFVGAFALENWRVRRLESKIDTLTKKLDTLVKKQDATDEAVTSPDKKPAPKGKR